MKKSEVIPIDERKWHDILACQHFRGNTLQAKISKLVMRLARHFHQDERETDGAVHWNSMVQNCEEHVRRPEGKNSRTQIGFSTLMEEATG